MEALAVVAATVADFGARTGAERVMALVDSGDAEQPVLVERLPDGTVQITEGDAVRTFAAHAEAPLPLGRIRPVPASALGADPVTGELAAPIGSVRLLADSVLALARSLGGRSVATATFPTRDPALPLTLAAREGEPVVLDLAGRQFALPP